MGFARTHGAVAREDARLKPAFEAKEHVFEIVHFARAKLRLPILTELREGRRGLLVLIAVKELLRTEFLERSFDLISGSLIGRYARDFRRSSRCPRSYFALQSRWRGGDRWLRWNYGRRLNVSLSHGLRRRCN